MKRRESAKKEQTGGTEVEMEHMQEDDEQQQLVGNPDDKAFDENDGEHVKELFTCEVRILCMKNGCGGTFSESERSKIKLCICFDQK